MIKVVHSFTPDESRNAFILPSCLDNIRNGYKNIRNLSIRNVLNIRNVQ